MEYAVVIVPLAILLLFFMARTKSLGNDVKTANLETSVLREQLEHEKKQTSVLKRQAREINSIRGLGEGVEIAVKQTKTKAWYWELSHMGKVRASSTNKRWRKRKDVADMVAVLFPNVDIEPHEAD